MPETYFSVRWPDGTRMACQSPSTIIGRHLPPGAYRLADFLARARTGFAAASARVREVHGFPCGLADVQLQAIELAACNFLEGPDALVIVEHAPAGARK